MIPVITIHNGYQEYFDLVLRQAAKNNNVILLGDSRPEIGGVNYLKYDDFASGFDKFAEKYEHLNTTPYDYELFCYKRWFVLRNLMNRENLEAVFYIDSDVLLFANADKEWEKFKQYDFTLLHRTAAISSFITKRGINNFCDMLLNIYGNKGDYPFKKIKSHFQIRQDCGLSGGVCDMTLLEWFHYHSEFGGGPGNVGEMMQIIDGSTYDHNIHAKDQDFAFVNGMKSVQIIGGQPYVYSEKLRQNIRFNSLHFQGGAKSHIRGIYEQCL